MSVFERVWPLRQYDDEIDIRELFRIVWVGKWLISGITVGATILAVIYALNLPNIYRAEALLAPNEQDGPGALVAQFGGLASIAGINLNSGKAYKTVLGLEVLKSRKFSQSLSNATRYWYH